MKIIIAGGRDFNDKKKLIAHLNLLAIDGHIPDVKEKLEIVCGMARGADSVGLSIAVGNGLKVAKFPAHWDRYGKSAGYRRNVEMGDYADFLVACWDGQSKGTKHMIDIMEDKGKPVSILKY